MLNDLTNTSDSVIDSSCFLQRILIENVLCSNYTKTITFNHSLICKMLPNLMKRSFYFLHPVQVQRLTNAEVKTSCGSWLTLLPLALQELQTCYF